MVKYFIIFLQSIVVFSCGQKSETNSNKGSGQEQRTDENIRPKVRFGTVLSRFQVNGTEVTYALAQTRVGQLVPGQQEKYYCSLNGSPFELCLQSGNLPVTRLILGINVFQAQVVVGGTESANPVYREFVIGQDSVSGL